MSDQASEVNGTNVTDPMLEIGSLVMIKTNWGDIVIGMYEVGAPITTSNFLNLTRTSFYNGIKFHRIVDDFVIQTGDPNTRDNNPYNDGWGGSPETIPLEVSENLTHLDGAVGMARSSEPDSASSQFYICDGPQHGLDGNYAVFAMVVEGMDTVRKIASAEVYGNTRPLLREHPVDDIIMESVTILPKEREGTGDNGPGGFSGMDGLSVGLGGFFVLGLGLIVIVVVAFLVRKVYRRVRTSRMEQVFEVELLDVRDLDEQEEEGWGKPYREQREWYED